MSHDGGECRTTNGWRAFVSIKGRQFRKRFKADSTPAQREAWRLKVRLGQLVKAENAPKPDTFAADIVTYLGIVRAMPTIDTRTTMMQAWRDVFGPDRDRRTITSAEIAAQLAAWGEDYGYAASTLNHYRGASS